MTSYRDFFILILNQITSTTLLLFVLDVETFSQQKAETALFFMDVMMALRCDYFLASCFSNISRFVQLNRDKPLNTTMCIENKYTSPPAGCPRPEKACYVVAL